MPTYKLYYFNSKGRAEHVRWIFAQAGVPYEDVRIDGAEWLEIKPTMSFGKMPVMDVDGKRLAGSIVISRYLAEEYGLAGSNAFENSEVAAVADAVNDLSLDTWQVFYDKKEAMYETFWEKSLPAALTKFNELASTNDKGYLWGNKLTWPDLFLVFTVSYIESNHPGLLGNYSALKKLKETVETLPNITKWLKKRPVTQF